MGEIKVKLTLTHSLTKYNVDHIAFVLANFAERYFDFREFLSELLVKIALQVLRTHIRTDRHLIIGQAVNRDGCRGRWHN